MTDDEILRLEALKLAVGWDVSNEALIRIATSFYNFIRDPPEDALVELSKQATYEAERRAWNDHQVEALVTELRGIRSQCGPACRSRLMQDHVSCDCGELEAVKDAIGKEVDGNGERG